MTDEIDLAALAQAAKAYPLDYDVDLSHPAVNAFIEACSPDAVLALIRERDEARAQIARMGRVSSFCGFATSGDARCLGAEAEVRRLTEERDDWEAKARAQGAAYTEVELLGHQEAERRKGAEKALQALRDGITALADRWEALPQPPDEDYDGTTEGHIAYGEWSALRFDAQRALRALLTPDGGDA